MDPLSQAALGAAWAEPVARRDRLAAAGSLGGLAGMAPDLDLLIGSESDPLLGLELHRQFTHSLFFIPFGAAICAAAFYWLVRARLSFKQTYVFCALGYASHGLLDACTTYGTQLFWPFSAIRVAWNVVSVVDPLFTLPVLALVVVAARRRRVVFGVAALVWAGLYLGLGGVQNVRSAAIARDLAAQRGHEPVRLETKPAFASILLWKSIYEHAGRFYVDAIRVGLGATVFEGESVEKLDVARHLPWLDEDSTQARDLERFRRFSDDYLAPSDEVPGYVIDMRYSLVPNRVDGLWGIVLDAEARPNEHVTYVTTRNRSLAEGHELLEMLFR